MAVMSREGASAISDGLVKKRRPKRDKTPAGQKACVYRSCGGLRVGLSIGNGQTKNRELDLIGCLQGSCHLSDEGK